MLRAYSVFITAYSLVCTLAIKYFMLQEQPIGPWGWRIRRGFEPLRLPSKERLLPKAIYLIWVGLFFLGCYSDLFHVTGCLNTWLWNGQCAGIRRATEISAGPIPYTWTPLRGGGDSETLWHKTVTKLSVWLKLLLAQLCISRQYLATTLALHLRLIMNGDAPILSHIL